MAAGLGFSFAIDKIRELLVEPNEQEENKSKIIITYSNDNSLQKALQRQNYWHKQGLIAQVEHEPYVNKEDAMLLKKERGVSDVEWINTTI